MRLVTDSPIEYFTWLLFGILAVVVFVGIMFFIAWLDVYVIQPYKRHKREKK